LAKTASTLGPVRTSVLETDLVLAAGQDPFGVPAIKTLAAKFGSPLLIIDADRVRAQFRRLKAALPGVYLHYALKPLPEGSVVATLRDAGAWFDLATSGEVNLVRRLGVSAARCIHTHPIKRDSDIRDALDYGVRVFVVDNPDELRKFAKYRGRVSLLIRLSFRSPDAVCDLSRKFGCDPEAVPSLLALADQLRLDVEGLSFHVGSQAGDPSKHVEAIGVCRDLVRAACETGRKLRTLDIGGGFPVEYQKPVMAIEEFCAPIRAALASLPQDLRIIAEPGRYIAAPSAIAVSTVMGRAERDQRWWYYLDDGVYGSYSGQLYDHAKYPVAPLDRTGSLHPAVLAGPTCDSIDVIDDRLELPLLEIGDLLVGRTMGAYTSASATEFNFFPKATVLAIDNGRLLTPGGSRLIAKLHATGQTSNSSGL
jgi:ornithine decarboxylase